MRRPKIVFVSKGGRAHGETQELIQRLICENNRITAENERLRVRHASYDRQIRADVRRQFAEKLKNYYIKNCSSLKGSINCDLVAYHIDQILEDMERKEEQ